MMLRCGRSCIHDQRVIERLSGSITAVKLVLFQLQLSGYIQHSLTYYQVRFCQMVPFHSSVAEELRSGYNNSARPLMWGT